MTAPAQQLVNAIAKLRVPSFLIAAVVTYGVMSWIIGAFDVLTTTLASDRFMAALGYLVIYVITKLARNEWSTDE